jgi:hypothetical protein
MDDLDFHALWERALTYDEFVKQSTEHCGLWTGVYRLAHIPPWALERACAVGRTFRLLVLAEDWCGDASNTVPFVAKLGSLGHCLEMRILRRDENPDVMDRYLSGTARAIPIVIVLDETWREVGHWGSRPAELQAWVLEARKTTPKEDLYPQIRRWYAKDKGESTLREILALLPAVNNSSSSRTGTVLPHSPARNRPP